MNKKVVLALIVVLVLALSACSAATQSAIATGVAQTQQISQLQTQAAGGGNAAAEAPQSGDAAATEGDTATAEETPTPSNTPKDTNTPTPDTPMISVSQNTNCRSGPSVSYGYSTTVNAGVLLEVVGVPSDATVTEYVIVKKPAGESGNCWLWTRYADKTDFSAYNLQQYNTPATPTPTYTPTPSFDWSGTWNINVGGPIYTMVLNVSGNTLSSTFVYAAPDSVSLVGTISSDGQTASGNYTDTNGPPGTFQWKIKSGNINQFIGSANSGATFAWCGAKNGASIPSPCQWP